MGVFRLRRPTAARTGGVSLRHLIDTGGELDLAALLLIHERSLAALQSLHQVGRAHGSVTADTIHLAEDGTVTLDSPSADQPVTEQLLAFAPPMQAIEAAAAAEDIRALTDVLVMGLTRDDPGGELPLAARELVRRGLDTEATDPPSAGELRADVAAAARAFLGEEWRLAGTASILAAMGHPVAGAILAEAAAALDEPAGAETAAVAAPIAEPEPAAETVAPLVAEDAEPAAAAFVPLVAEEAEEPRPSRAQAGPPAWAQYISGVLAAADLAAAAEEASARLTPDEPVAAEAAPAVTAFEAAGVPMVAGLSAAVEPPPRRRAWRRVAVGAGAVVVVAGGFAVLALQLGASPSSGGQQNGAGTSSVIRSPGTDTLAPATDVPSATSAATATASPVASPGRRRRSARPG